MKLNQDSESGRRDFLKTCSCALAGVAMMGVGSTVAGCEFSHVSDSAGLPTRRVEIDVSSLSVDGTGLKIRVAVVGFVVAIRKAATDYIAMSAVCPHANFTVHPPENGEMLCQGHQSTFDLDGIAKPGGEAFPGALTRFPSTYDAARKVLTIMA